MKVTPLCLLLASSFLLTSPVNGQIAPDGTLPTQVERTGNQFEITGGSNPEGSNNLFHSFAEFSVPTNGAAIFQNASNITNIISRVTGSALSNIDGLIQANNANLILINPNGIIFGPNAQLDIGGSFLGTTANSVQFADGTEFMASAQQPMLTVSVPVGVQFAANAAGIQAQGANLAVAPGQTLALVGGDLTIAGSRLSTPGGRIELGSVAGSGFVNLRSLPQGLELDYNNVQNFGTIQIGQALIDTSGLGGGDVQVQGGRLVINEGAQIRSFTLGNGAGGTVALRASESVDLIGRGFAEFQENFIAAALSGTINPAAEGTGVLVGTAGTGAASNIVIDTPALNLREGAVLVSPTFSEGAGGNITIESESVELDSSGILSGTAATGASGGIRIDTARLGVRDKSVIINAVLGNGTGGDVEIKASEAVEVTSFDTETIPQGIFLATGIYTNTNGGTGRGGNLTLDVAGDLIVRNGVIASNTGALLPDQIIPLGGPGGDLTVNARHVELSGVIAERFNSGIGTTTFSNSPAGDLTIFTETLLVQQGADISTATLNSGTGGTLTVNASESVELIGARVNGLDFGGLVATSGRPNFPELDVRGDSGDLSVVTDELIVRDGASIDVQSLGSGNAGTLSVEANTILVDNGSAINASTQSGQGGNISLKAEDIRWRRGSETTATAMGTGDGGNIFIEANILIALEDSDITANAVAGRGGNIFVETEGLFLCAECDVIASSELGVDGVVEITTPETETNLEFIEVPEGVIDPEQAVALACASNGGQNASRLAIAGRGGLPPRPSEPLNPDAIVSFEPPPDRATAPDPSKTLAPPAQGWSVNEQGVVVLTAQAQTETPQAGLTPPDCDTP